MSLLSTRSESKDFEPSNPFQNDRKIAVRRPRRTNLCNKAELYHEKTCKVNYLAHEPRTKYFSSLCRLPHVQPRGGPFDRWLVGLAVELPILAAGSVSLRRPS